MVERLFKKFSQWILQFSGGVCEFLENKKNKKPRFLFLPLSGILKISGRKYKAIKRVICNESMCKLENLFKAIVMNTFISFGESGQLVLPR